MGHERVYVILNLRELPNYSKTAQFYLDRSLLS
jgi:hypothetical protein